MKPTKERISGKQIAIIAIAVVVVLNLISSIPSFFGVLSKFFGIISPFIGGFVIAFLLNIPTSFFEKKVFGSCFNKKGVERKGLRRFFSFIISTVIVLLILFLLVTFIYREIYESIMEFSKKLPEYAVHFQQGINNVAVMLEDIGIAPNLSESLEKIDFLAVFEEVKNWTSKLSPDIVGGAVNAVVGVTNMVIGITGALFNFVLSIVFAIYLIFSKEKIILQAKKIMYAYLDKQVVRKLRYVGEVTKYTFERFTVGQLTETLILGVMYFVIASVTRMPYPALIAVLMAIGGIIPVIGPVMTAVPSALIVFMAGGFNQALWFVLISVVVQQVESNVIYPRVIGESIGLPGVWVLLAVLIGASSGGMAGMIISVPLASVLYRLLGENVKKRVSEKGITAEELGIEEKVELTEEEKN